MPRKVTENNLLPAAQIVKSYDTTGEVVIRFTSGLLEDYDIKEPVFIYFDELPVPFFIERLKNKGRSGAIVKFDTVNDLKHSEELIKKDLYIDAGTINETIHENAAEEDIASFLTGFRVTDHSGKQAGIITAYYSYPNNPCIEITPSENTRNPFLVPFNEELILDIDTEKKNLRMHIPSGLPEL